ncbi:DUF6479 family protein [Streptomyces sp. NPDC048254]|uniref:DUF6479 family protein n=1 Tax=Streptomyces sp. NPDC048254 TaxID=3365525 RepID=UPI003712E58E
MSVRSAATLPVTRRGPRQPRPFGLGLAAGTVVIGVRGLLVAAALVAAVRFGIGVRRKESRPPRRGDHPHTAALRAGARGAEHARAERGAPGDRRRRPSFPAPPWECPQQAE